jgi:hypothetical protein
MESQLMEAKCAQEERVRGEARRADVLKDEVLRLRSMAISMQADLEARKKAVAADLDAMQRCGKGPGKKFRFVRGHHGENTSFVQCPTTDDIAFLLRTFEAEMFKTCSDLSSALDMMVQHRLWVQQRVEKVVAATRQAHAEVAQGDN